MKKFLFLTAILDACLLWGAAPEKGLLLQSSFSHFSTRPDYAANPATVTGGIHHDLQLRNYIGPNGRPGAVSLSNKEFISYTQQGNLDLRCGSISMWVKPVNWKPADNKSVQVFFDFRAGDFKHRICILKVPQPNVVTASLIINKKTYPVRETVRWAQGEWHKIDLTWNSNAVKLYLDGRPPAPGARSQFKIQEKPDFPDKIFRPTMGINYYPRWNINPEWITAYDDFKIYNRVRTPEEILEDYHRIVPRKDTSLRPLVTSPATVPISTPTWHNRDGLNLESTVRISHDKKELCLDFMIPRTDAKAVITKRDGEIWLDDSAEFHVIGRDGKRRQFIVNAAGALYDSLERDPSWNSNARVSGKKYPGYWTARLQVPLADLNVGTEFKGNFGVTDSRRKYAAYTWSQLPERMDSFDMVKRFGTIRLGSAADRVDLDTLGDVRSGKLDVKVSAAKGIRILTRCNALNGTSITGSRNKLAEGQTDIIITALNARNKCVGRYFRQVQVKPPFTNSVYIYPLKKQMECRLDFSASGMENARGSVVITGLKDKKVYLSKAFHAPGQEHTLFLPLPELPDNARYRVTAKVGHFSTDFDFTVPDMTPYRKKIGVDHTVPAPWTKVLRSGKTLKVLDRSYLFENGPLPSQVISRGRKLLQAPPQFVINGEAVKWTKAVFGKNHGDYAEVSGTGSFKGGKMQLNGELWFDGMYKFTLRLIPQGSLKLRSMKLQYAVLPDSSRYALRPAHTPWKNDQLREFWDPREYHSLLWLTGVETGFAWWCSSNANWIINPNKPNLFVDRLPEKTTVDINMIARPAELKKTAQYVMVFQATPPRRPDLKFREYVHSQRSISYRKRYMRMDEVDVNDGTEQGNKSDHNIRNWVSLEPRDPVKFRKFMQLMHKQKFRTLLYAMPVHISPLDEEYTWFFPTSKIEPGYGWQTKDVITKVPYVVHNTCGHMPIADLHAYRIDKLYREVPELDGLYFDIMHCRTCENEHHGCGGIDAFGQKYKTSYALNTRAYILRVLKIHQKHRKHFSLHAHNAFFPFVHDLCSVWMPGEELFEPIAKNPFWGYFETVSEEAYQAAWSNVIRGVWIDQIPQQERIVGQMPHLDKALKEKLRSFKYAARATYPTFLYDFTQRSYASERPGHPIYRGWDIRKDAKFGLAEFHPYWVDPATVSAAPVKVSWYSWKDKAAPYPFMLCAVNTGRKDIKTDLVIDWKKLKSKPCKLKDLWGGKVFTEKELASFVLEGQSMLLLVPAGEVR